MITVPVLGQMLDIPRCPHCRIDNPNINLLAGNYLTQDYRAQHKRLWKVYSCTRCGGAILASAREDGNPVTEMYPSPSVVDADLPERAHAFLSQAMDSVHAPSGAVILAASAVDAMLKGKGLRTGSLYNRIDQAAREHYITAEMAQWAHQVRLDANDQRHADEDAPLPSEEDARRSIEFARALGQFLYTLPARVTRGLNASTPSSS